MEMGYKKWSKVWGLSRADTESKQDTWSRWKNVSRMLALSLLSLILPLSFLLLARLSTAHHRLLPPPPPLIISFTPSSLALLPYYLFLYINSTLYALLSLLCVGTLVHALTGRLTNSSVDPLFRPRLYVAWVLLCTLQICVGLGVESSIAAGIDGSSGMEQHLGWWSKMMFFLGLHETMVFWSTSVVKPVVDDTILGFPKEESLMERAVMGSSFGVLWWLGLKEEVDSLVVAGELRWEVSLGVANLLGWWLYYTTVVIGCVRVLKGLAWMANRILFFITNLLHHDHCHHVYPLDFNHINMVPPSSHLLHHSREDDHV